MDNQPTNQPEPMDQIQSEYQPAEAAQAQSAKVESLAPTTAPGPSQEDPGRKLGIIGLVFAFLFPLAGIVISIMALVKSKKARAKNIYAILGLALSSIFTVSASIILTVVMAASYANISSEANAVAAANNATTVSQTALNYWSMAGNYPDEIADFSSTNVLGNYTLPISINLVDTPSKINKDNGQKTVSYEYCGVFGKPSGGRIQYWDYKTDKLADYTFVGGATASTVCYPAK